MYSKFRHYCKRACWDNGVWNKKFKTCGNVAKIVSGKQKKKRVIREYIHLATLLLLLLLLKVIKNNQKTNIKHINITEDKHSGEDRPS
jgi:hypothetical protein